MNLEDYRTVFFVSSLIMILIASVPMLRLFLPFSTGERFSELWILGPGHMAEVYPFNVKADEAYKVYLGVGNHMGGLEYYRVYVKFRNQTEPLPDTLNGTPSVLDPVFEYDVFLRDNETWEEEVSFSFEGVSFQGNACRVSELVMDSYVLNVDKVTVWDEENKGFYFQLFFELWIYNVKASSFQYHNRFVGIWLNMTRSL